MSKRVLLLVLVSCIAFTGLSQSAKATPLNLVLSDYPDITSGFMDVTYTASNDQLLVDGFATHIWDGVSAGPDEIVAAGYNYNITATIDEFGNASAGTLTITGTIPTWDLLDSGILLTGTLTAFGFQETGGDPLEFLFDVTGGDLAEQFHQGPIGVILSNAEFDGSFASDFNNYQFYYEYFGAMHGDGWGLAVADTYPNPEPTTLCLLTVGLLVARTSRKRKNS